MIELIEGDFMFKETFFDFLHIPIQYRSYALPKLFKILLIVCFAILINASPVQAHSGRTDSNGGHYVTDTGEYHYHHGYPSHQHLDGICTYKNIAHSNSSSGSHSELFMIFISLVGGVSILFALKVCHDKIKKKQQFEREKLYFSNLYKGKSIYELANVPENIDFDENDLPISIDDSGLEWGKEFTVYVTKYGQCYHRNRSCSGAYNPVHIFNEAKKISAIGCRKCSSGERFIIPEWYYKYLEIKKIKSRYGIKESRNVS